MLSKQEEAGPASHLDLATSFLKINGGKPTESQHFHRNILQFLLYAFAQKCRNVNFSSEYVFKHF